MNSGPAHFAEPAQLPSRGRRWATWLLLVAVAVLLYLPYAGIPRYADDYLFMFRDPRAELFSHFVAVRDFGGLFRPLQMTWGGMWQLLSGDGTRGMQLGQALLHGVLAALVCGFMWRSGIPRGPAVLATLVLVTHPVAVGGVLGNDTFSQLAVTTLGFASFAAAWRYGRIVSCARVRPGALRCVALGVAGIVSLVAALLSKESGVGFGGLIVLALGYWGLRAPVARRPALLGLCAAYGVTLVAYFLYRRCVAPLEVDFGGPGDYSFRLGANVPINQLMLYFAALLPASTADVYVAVRRAAPGPLVSIALLTAAWAGLLVWGLWRARALRMALGLLFAVVCATVPMTFMNHVSELHAYNLLPFTVVLMGMSLGALLRAPWGARRLGAAAVLLFVLVSQVVAVTRKAEQMRAVGNATARLLPQVREHARGLPPGGTLLLVERPAADACFYSVFLCSEFHGLRAIEPWLRHWLDRPDISVRLADINALTPADLYLVREDTPSGPRARPWSPPATPRAE